MRYMKRPSVYHEMDFLTYIEGVKLYKTLPRSFQSRAGEILQAGGSPANYVVTRTGHEDTVARMRFVPPSNVDLFAFRLILLHKQVSSFQDARTWEG